MRKIKLGAKAPKIKLGSKIKRRKKLPAHPKKRMRRLRTGKSKIA